MTFDEYLTNVETALITHPSWRQGQTFFNVLATERPALSEQVRGTLLDPFYKAGDELVPFFEWVSAKW